MGLNPGVSGKTLWLSGSSLQGTPPSDKDKPEDEQAYEKVPDYLTDLNAMHEAEKTLGSDSPCNDNRRLYAMNLLSVVLGVDVEPVLPMDWSDCWFLSTPTAAQRAEAFLRTIGKYTEPSK